MLSVKPNRANFGPVVELGGHGGRSKAVKVVLFNPKNRRQNTSIQIEAIEPSDGQFQVQPNSCVGALAPGGKCSVAVVFSPIGSGSRSGSLIITDNTATHQHSVTLKGTGKQGLLSYRPKSLNFGKVPLHLISVKTVTLKNPNPVEMSLGTISVDNHDFSLGGTCGNSLAAASSCTIQVIFTPSQTQKETGTITIPDNAVGNAHKVKLTGSGK